MTFGPVAGEEANSMSLEAIFDKRIIFMTGKGGVGKTTLSVALAWAAQERGKNVILMEVDNSPNLRYILGRDIPVYKETRVAPRLSVFTLEPFKALEEYAALQIKVAAAARLFLNNRFVSYFMQAAPGWRELVTVGKIWHTHQRTVGRGKNRRPEYDMIVVDAPATGHGLSFLRVPAIFADILKFGRMQSQTNDLLDMLRDPERTVVNVVSLPEEMPLNEAVTLVNTAKSVMGMQVGVTFMNGVHPAPFLPDEKAACDNLLSDSCALETLGNIWPCGGKALFDAAADRQARAQSCRQYLDLAAERLPTPIVELPYEYPGRVDMDGVKRLACLITKALSGGA
jgi:anion-transporting  ArsA/GET3 family ATPase